MTREIRFQDYLTFDDSLRVQQALRHRSPIPTAAAITAATLAAAALVLWRMQTALLPAFLLLAFMGTFMAVGFRVLAASTRSSRRKIYDSACIARRGVLKTDGIHIKRGRTRKVIPWAHFDRLVEVDDIVALANDRESLGFARYMFNTDSEWSRARALIRERGRRSGDAS